VSVQTSMYPFKMVSSTLDMFRPATSESRHLRLALTVAVAPEGGKKWDGIGKKVLGPSQVPFYQFHPNLRRACAYLLFSIDCTWNSHLFEIIKIKIILLNYITF